MEIKKIATQDDLEFLTSTLQRLSHMRNEIDLQIASVKERVLQIEASCNSSSSAIEPASEAESAYAQPAGMPMVSAGAQQMTPIIRVMECPIPETKILELNLPQHFDLAKYALLRSFGKDFNCGDFFAMDEAGLLRLRGVGKSKLQPFQDLRDLIATEAETLLVNEAQADWPDKEILSELLVNYGFVSASQKKLLERLAKSSKVPLEQINVAQLLDGFNPRDMSRTINGQSLQEVREELLNEIRPCLDQFLDKSESELKKVTIGGQLVSYAGPMDFTSQELADILSADLTAFLNSLNKRDRLIVENRFGLDGAPLQTLGAIGDILGENLTRERVRQLETHLITQLLSSLSIHPENIWANMKTNLVQDIGSLYPALYQRFTSDKGFVKFIERICQVKKGSIRDHLYPPCQPDFARRLAEVISVPIDGETLIETMMDEYGFTRSQAENGLNNLVDQKDIEHRADGYYPKGLTKPQAVAQAALHFPDGTSFREIHRLANEQGLTNTQFTLERQDSGLSGAVDGDLIFLCGHGMYKHLKFLGLENDDINTVLGAVYDELYALAQRGINSANLHVDIYEKCNFSHDYFTVRHVVREHGFERGIYFSGKSGADTASLEEDFALKGQKTAVLQLFEQDPKPRTSRDVADVIRSASINHAGFYISELVEENKLVKIDSIHYDLPRRAFSDAPVSIILDKIERMLLKADGPVQISKIAEECNIRLHLNHTKYWFRSLIQHYSDRFDKKLHIDQSLVVLGNGHAE